jgi:hypothetical protein
LYLAVMIDLHSRRVIGWATSNRLKRDLALQALNNAVALRNPPQGCLHHTDRGSQGRFKRPSQHPNNGGDDVNLQTRVRSVHSEKNTFAWTSTCLAA